jgi:hypothetical protein
MPVVCAGITTSFAVDACASALLANGAGWSVLISARVEMWTSKDRLTVGAVSNEAKFYFVGIAAEHRFLVEFLSPHTPTEQLVNNLLPNTVKNDALGQPGTTKNQRDA